MVGFQRFFPTPESPVQAGQIPGAAPDVGMRSPGIHPQSLPRGGRFQLHRPNGPGATHPARAAGQKATVLDPNHRRHQEPGEAVFLRLANGKAGIGASQGGNPRRRLGLQHMRKTGIGGKRRFWGRHQGRTTRRAEQHPHRQQDPKAPGQVPPCPRPAQQPNPPAR